MPNSVGPRDPSSLTVVLDAQLLAQLERYAAQHLISVSDFVRNSIQQAMAREMPRPARRNKSSTERPDEAPLDAFLPEGVDPFAPAEVAMGLASNFEEIQARMRFAGTPALLRDL